jgi:DNA-binding NarL/FixJ family response regulator
LLDVLALIARSCVILIGPTIAERFWSYPATPVAVQLPGPNLPSLTGRELAILEKLAAGLSEQQAAAAEGISVSTARRAVAELQAKLDAPSLFTLALRASQLGLIH